MCMFCWKWERQRGEEKRELRPEVDGTHLDRRVYACMQRKYSAWSVVSEQVNPTEDRAGSERGLQRGAEILVETKREPKTTSV